MPVGLGFHPFFPVHPNAVLKAETRAVWLTDSESLPTERAPPHYFANWRLGACVLPDMAIDNCYEKWTRTLTLSNGEGTTIMTASPALNWLHLYIPPRATFLCAEPVSHMPDAFNRDGRATGARLLEPGKRWSVWMRINVA
jgi:aldose 1-epimerase